jgi:serine/threonine protein kinase
MAARTRAPGFAPWTACLVAVAAIAAAGWLAQRPSTSLVSVLSSKDVGDGSRLLHENPEPGSILRPATIAASGDACVGRENACDLAFSLEEVIPRANPVSRWPNWPEVYRGEEVSADDDFETSALELEELGVGEGGWEELDGVVALGLEGVAARLPALAPGPNARASALMEIPRASKAVVTRFLGAVGASPIVQAPAGRKEKNEKNGASASPTRSGAAGEGYVPTERAPFARGHFGEVWRARAVGRGGEKVVLKRVLVERGEEIRLSGRREAYFGEALRAASGGDNVARYESAFELIPGDGRIAAETELWLVFRDEGESLASLMYTDTDKEGDEKEKTPREGERGDFFRVVGPSRWWLAARETSEGRRMLREVLRQTLEGVAFTHARGIGHRDVKPANLLVSFGDEGEKKKKTKKRRRGGGEAKKNADASSEASRPSIRVRLADFGSAVDEHAIASLYGPEGPSAAQQTREYAPPESFGAASVFDGRRRNGGAEADAPKREYYAAYDVFSVGVVALEVLCLGTPKVFASVDGRTRASVTRRLQGASEETKELALRVRALLELCVTPPLEIDGLLSWECTEDALAARLASRDPTGLGVHSKWALRLIRRLLSWDPERRPTAEQALTHAYFRGEGPEGVPFRCERDGREHDFEFRSDCLDYCSSPPAGAAASVTRSSFKASSRDGGGFETCA